MSLDLPEDVSGLSDDEKEKLAAQKRAKYHELDFVIDIEVASNDDRPELITPELLKFREQQKLDRLKYFENRREEAVKQDREFLGRRWAKTVPPAFKHARIEDLPEDLHKLCSEWMYQDTDCRRNLILTGATGVGKTFTSHAIMRELYITRNRYLNHSMPEILDAIRPGESAKDSFKKVKSIPYLFIQDAGAEKDSSWTDERLFMLFDHRWQYCLPTVITSNVPPEDFFDIFGERVTSRMLDGAKIRKIKGDDRRLQ